MRAVSDKHRTTFLRLFLLFAKLALARALTNVTVDDETGDALTGDKPMYTPLESGSNGNWAQGSACSVCLVRPDASRALDGTWHDATHAAGDPLQKTIEISFTGTAVYTYFICANTVDGATTLTNLTFALDGGQVGTFVHVPDATSDYEYNVLGYAGTNLSNGRHQLLIQTTGDVNNSLVLFDYLIYSTDQGTTTTSSGTSTTGTATSQTSSTSAFPGAQSTGTGGSKKTGAIIGAVVGVVAAVAIATLGFLWWRRRRGGGGTLTGGRKLAKVSLDENDRDYSVNNAAVPMPYMMSQSNSSEFVQPNMAESQYLMPSAERTGAMGGFTHPSKTIANSSLLAVQNPDGSDAGRSDVSAASVAVGSGPVAAANGDIRKARERQTEIGRQVQEIQQRVAILRSQSTHDRQGYSPSGLVPGTSSDSEVEFRNQIAALQAEVERLQTQQKHLQQLGWGNEPPPQYASDDGLDNAMPRSSYI